MTQKPDPMPVSDKIVTLSNSLQEKPSMAARERLTGLVNELINTDFQALIQLLYRIDVNENKLKEILKNNPHLESAPLITNLIIERQLEKIKMRKHFEEKNNDDDEEKW